MKKIILITLVTLFAGMTAMAQGGVEFRTGTFKEIAAEAQKADKYIFMDIYATWCGPCKRMSNEIFPQAQAGEYFNKTFINAKFDAEKGEGIQLAQKYNVTAYPTFLILDSSGEEVARVIGGAGTPAAFIARVQAALK